VVGFREYVDFLFVAVFVAIVAEFMELAAY
jgi:hypothetical protein